MFEWNDVCAGLLTNEHDFWKLESPLIGLHTRAHITYDGCSKSS